jgi:hypothetical protein
LAFCLTSSSGGCQEPKSHDDIKTGDIQTGEKHWVVTIVGMPGDEDHARQFQEISSSWQKRLAVLGIPTDHLWLLRDKSIADTPDDQSLTRELLAAKFTELGQKIQDSDTLWVFVLGHANHDDGRAAFHVRGVDPEDSDFAASLDAIRCQQQIVWLTHSCSGWFVKRLSAPSRIVIAATAADHEPNETEFPHALASVLEREPRELDMDGDHCISVMELFSATVRETEKRFASDKRLPTEHAQLDDNGNGKGTELADIQIRDQRQLDLPPAPAGPLVPPDELRDGLVASLTLFPLIIPPENDNTEPSPAPESNSNTP